MSLSEKRRIDAASSIATSSIAANAALASKREDKHGEITDQGVARRSAWENPERLLGNMCHAMPS